MIRRLTLFVALVAPLVSGATFAAESRTWVTPQENAAEIATLRQQLADITVELDQLRQDVRELRGQLEVQTHDLQTIKGSNRETLSDMDKRLRDVERRGPSASVEGPSNDAEPSGKTPTAAVPAGAGEQREYDAAFGLMKQGFYEKAAKGFRDFVAKYPNSELAGNAQYWAGEAQYVVRNFKQASDDFTKVVDKYPSSPKVADALLKIGYSQQELGNLDKARETLQQLIRRYPNTTAAKSAEKRLADMNAGKTAKPKAPDPKSGKR